LGQGKQCSPAAGAAADDDLLQAIAKGDQLAFRRLMERHAKPMLALAHRLTGSAEDADEVVQEAFLKVWRLAERWEVNGAAAFSTWFYRVVFNACLDRRRRAPMAPLEDAGTPIDPAPIGSETAQDKQRRQAIVAALEELPERQKKAVWLYYFGEVSGPQAAETLGMSLSALEALLVRGRRSLKKALIKRGIVSIGDIL
jgi:RNA polymerase sigma-70 factor (ECF subfamily)